MGWAQRLQNRTFYAVHFVVNWNSLLHPPWKSLHQVTYIEKGVLVHLFDKVTLGIKKIIGACYCTFVACSRAIWRNLWILEIVIIVGGVHLTTSFSAWLIPNEICSFFATATILEKSQLMHTITTLKSSLYEIIFMSFFMIYECARIPNVAGERLPGLLKCGAVSAVVKKWTTMKDEISLTRLHAFASS